MEFSKGKMKQLTSLLLLAALLVLGLIYSDRVFWGIGFVFGIAGPFVSGGVVAFVLNLPLKLFEEKLLKRWRGRAAAKVKRPLCIVLSLVSVVLVISLVVGTVVPQVTATAGEVGKKIPGFLDKVVAELEKLTQNYPQLAEKVAELETLEIDWNMLTEIVVDFLKNGAGDVLTSTVSVASGIIGGIVNGVIAFTFALYILAQKEKLEDQGRRIIRAYLPEQAGTRILEVCSMLYKNFSSFITGQCLEAVILGFMFVVSMSIFRMPYALMIGVLIAFTALIPIVGAFIGCFVGAFMILMDNPVQALWFVILFLILQQLEGNLVYPRVMGNSVGLPSIWVLMAVSLGGSLFGIGGMLFFIPLFSTFYALFRESVNKRNAQKSCRAGLSSGGQISRSIQNESLQKGEKPPVQSGARRQETSGRNQKRREGEKKK